MPPKKQSAAQQTPSKSLLNFFDRSPNTAGTVAQISPGTSGANNIKPLKRRKSGASTKSVAVGRSGTSNAPLVISDDEDAGQEPAADKGDVQGGFEKSKATRATEEGVIDISDDDMSGDVSSTRRKASRGSRMDGEASTRLQAQPAMAAIQPTAISPIPTGAQLISNGILEPSGNMPEPLEVTSHASNIDNAIDGLPQPTIPVIPTSQASDLEQALEEEEGEWNEGDEEGMGMEDLEIDDDEEAMETLDTLADAEEQGKTGGGEKRKRKGKQKEATIKDCSPEIIALDGSDDGDDDSLGGREDVDDFDVDDDECPVCGRTFVGMRGDVSA